MKKEKNSKYGLLKVLGISFLVFAVLTWIIPSGTYSGATFTKGVTNPVGLYGLFINPIYSFGIFVQYVMVFLAIGGLYGILNKTGVYSKIVEGIAKKFDKKKKLYLIITIVSFALLSSLVGSNIALFVFVPFGIAILMVLGFDSVTSLAATAGAILVGTIGSTYGNAVIFKSFFAMDANQGILYKIILFVLVTTLYTLFIVFKNKPSKKVKANPEKPKKGKKAKEVLEKVTESVKKVEIPLYDDTKGGKKEKSSIPLIIILVLMALLIFAGMYNWYYSFGIDFFTNIHNSIMTFKVGNIAIFEKLFGSTLPEIGYFGNYDLASILVIFTILIGWIYGVKLGEFIDAFKEGCKKMLMPSIYIMLASTIFAIMVNGSSTGSISFTIVNFLLGLFDGFNALIITAVGIVNSLFFNDFPYMMNGIYGALATYETAVYPVISIILQSTFGLTMLVAPVSVILIAGLKYMNISYKDWMKYIWKFIVATLLLVIVLSLIVLTIVK